MLDKLDMVVHDFNSRIQEAEAGRLKSLRPVSFIERDFVSIITRTEFSKLLTFIKYLRYVLYYVKCFVYVFAFNPSKSMLYPFIDK